MTENFTFSSETINLLKNFASINTNFLFRQGSTIRTITHAKNVFAKATIAEVIPREFAIYDLNQLISILTLSEKPRIEFGSKSLKIQVEGGRFEFFYAEPKIITAPPDKDISITPSFAVELSANDVALVMKAAALTGAPHFRLKSEDGSKVVLSVCEFKNSTANSYEKDLGITTDFAFDVYIDVSNLKLIPDAYTMEVDRAKKVLRFTSATKNVEYFMALESDSVI